MEPTHIGKIVIHDIWGVALAAQAALIYRLNVCTETRVLDSRLTSLLVQG